ncbi:Nif3-like dinuclear metal center hexameric protein [Mesobacillus foraminis]|uniref:GTP cyclohydrolase 1 type 2 homolog n=1 Tax=Mesobacillus foraminis TaxID=279826 RepID=A0A4V2REC3_9BACI|nr:putative NIF3 family GTP cyclohydrolase 1 type 2 [Mesobacillus foraminis]
MISITTINDVIKQLTKPAGELETSVDSLLFGEPNTEVKGIVISFIATQYVIERAKELGANLIITHENPFYSHQGAISHIQNDPVYQAKRRLIEQEGMAIFRFHDHIHKYRPDGIMAGLIAQLGWDAFIEENAAAFSIVHIPSATVPELASLIKKKLEIPFVRVAGDISATCSRIGLLAGYRGGGQTAIPLFEGKGVDLIIAGEGPEWETPEYVRDSAYQGNHKAMIFLGHAPSEEPGMQLLAEQVRTTFANTPVHYIKSGNLFQIM